jgi:hypothetical protein
MEPPDTLNPQYVTDADGRRTGVLLSLDAFEALMEDLEDLAAVAERRDEPTVPHAEAVARLREDGLL